MINMSRPNSATSQVMRPSSRVASRPGLLAAALTASLVAGAALALQAHAAGTTPTRIGNTWNGFDHQPTQSQVQSAEQAGSVAPSVEEQRREARVVDELDRELLNGGDGSP